MGPIQPVKIHILKGGNMLLEDLLTGKLYIPLNGSYQELGDDDWLIYHQEGILPTVIAEMLERGRPVPTLWNVWTLENGSWSLSLREHEPYTSTSAPTVVVVGTPGTEPTDEQKAGAIEEYNSIRAKYAAAEAAWEAKAALDKAALDKASASLIGARVVKFELPTSDTPGYIILQTDEKELVHITSTHSVWDYGESSSDSLHFRVAHPDELL